MEPDRTRGASWLLPLLLVIAVVAQNFLSVRILQEMAALKGQVQSMVQGSTRPGAPSRSALEPGERPPGFTFADSGGRTRTLGDFSGRRLLLVFSSPSCPYCAELYPELRRFAEDPRFDDLDVLVLQIDSTPEENRKLRADGGLPFEVLAASADVFLNYGVPGTPFSVLVDEKGEVVRTGTVNGYEQLVRFATS